MEMFTVIASALIIFGAAFFSTVSGFGFALVATPLLSLFMQPRDAIIFVIAVSVVLRFINMFTTRGNIDKSVVTMCLIGTLAGIIPGSLVLRYIDINKLLIFLGCVLVIAAWLMGRKNCWQVKNKTLGRFISGLLSGFFGSATSISGPPLSLYFISEDMPKDVMRGNLIWIFGIGGFMMLLGSIWAGTFTLFNDLYTFLLMLPALFLGIYLGEHVFHKINQEFFRKLALMIVYGGAVSMLVNGISGLLM